MLSVKCECGWPIHSIKPVQLLCPICGATVSVGEGGPLLKSGKTASPRNLVSHWPELHQYSVETASSWSPTDAKEFYDVWKGGIPKYGCDCESNWKVYEAQNKPDFSSPSAFFEWGVEAHNYVSQNHANPRKPVMSLREVEGMFRAPWIDRRPRGMITFAVGDHLQVLDVTIPAMRAYANRVSAELIVLTDDLRPDWTMANKWRCSHYAWLFDRVLWVDSDVVISDKAPDIFAAHPAGFCVRDEMPDYIHRPGWYLHEVRELLASQGVDHELQITPNSGVMLYGPSEIDLYQEPPLKPYPKHWCSEQHWHSYKLDTNRDRLTLLDDRWNWSYIAPDWWQRLDEAYFIHLAGCHLLSHRIELAKRMAAGVFEPIPDPKGVWSPKRTSGAD